MVMQNKPQVLIENNCGSARLHMVEATGGKKRPLLLGEFARIDVPTQNGRLYPGPIWEAEIKRLNRALAERKWYGELDHPEDGKTKLQRVSHIVTRLWLEGNLVMGEAEILPTPTGEILKAIVSAGCPVGVSSRGFGDLRANESGIQVVQEGYRLEAFDVVADPADATAWPEAMLEAVSHLQESLDGQPLFCGYSLSEEAAGEEFDRAVNSLNEATAREVNLIAENILQSWNDSSNSVDAQGSRLVVDAVLEAIRPFIPPHTEDEIAKLQAENRQLKSLATQAINTLAFERQLGNHPQKDLALNLIGDIAAYESVEAFETRLSLVTESLTNTFGAPLTESNGRSLVERCALLERLVKQQQDELEDVTLLLQAERRIANHPKADLLREHFEVRPPRTEADIDRAIESHRPRVRRAGEIEAVAARVRAATRSGLMASASVEETPWRAPQAPSGNSGSQVLAETLARTRRFMPPGLDG